MGLYGETLSEEVPMVRVVLAALVYAALLCTNPLQAQAKMPSIANQKGVAVGGYDIVERFPNGTGDRLMGLLLWGEEKNVSTYKGVKYFFANKKNKETFDKDPHIFVLGIGGYSLGENASWNIKTLVPADFHHVAFFRGQWYAFSSDVLIKSWIDLPEDKKQTAVMNAWLLYEKKVDSPCEPANPFD